MKCQCGLLLNDIVDPSDIAGWLVRDIDRKNEPMKVGMYVWECPTCGRLGIERGKEIIWYKPESNQAANLFDY